MTMPFKLKDEWAFGVLEPGNRVQATLVVDGLRSWLENIIVMQVAVDESGASAAASSVGPKPGEEVPDFTLVNQDGKPIRLSQYKGKALALTFVYTRCPQPDQCTLMSTNFAAIEKDLQQQTDIYAKTHLLSITFDPEYDTPKVMRSYGASHTGRYSDEKFEHWEFTTGTADEVKRIAEFFGLRYFKDSSTGEEQVMHSLRTAVIDPDGKLVKLYRGNEWKPSELADDLKHLASTRK
jgi:protein SCO1/2